MHTLVTRIFVLGVMALASTAAWASDAGLLIDALVRKGILSDQEAKDLRADMAKDFAPRPAERWNMSSQITQFRLSGDFRYRVDLDRQGLWVASPAAGASTSNERLRNRFRFRVNFDLTLAHDWFAGVGLQTVAASDGSTQSFVNGFDNSGIFLNRAFFGWRPVVSDEWTVTLTLGKQRNPLYSTDLVWDPDINPQGFSQAARWRIDHDTTLDLNAAQFIYAHNSVTGLLRPSQARTNAWLFAQQAVFTQSFGAGELATASYFRLAPGFTFYNAATLENNFSDTVGFSNVQGFAGGNLAAPVNAQGIFQVGTTRSLQQLTFAGEVQYVLPAMPATPFRLYWDSAYNFQGGSRAYRVYGVARTFRADRLAWVIGVRLGQGGVSSTGTTNIAGDWSLDASYRQTGIGALDPNINDSEFALSRLNMQGWKVTGAYNFFDFVTGAVSFYDTQAAQDGLGLAPTTQVLNPQARFLFDRKDVRSVLIDLNVRF